MDNEELEVIENFEHRCVILKIKRDTVEQWGGNVYEAVRSAWDACIKRAELAEYVLAVCLPEEIIGVFQPKRWMEVTTENKEHFLNHTLDEQRRKSKSNSFRIGFIGKKASNQVQSLYLGKKLPLKYTEGQNPIRYTYNKG